MTENKIIELKVVCNAIEKIVKLDLSNERSDDRSDLPLCRVNQIQKVL